MRLAPFHLHQTANSTCETVQTVTVTYAAQSSRFAIIFIFIPKQCTETKFFSRQPNTQFRISLNILNYSIHCICFICYAVLLSDYIKKKQKRMSGSYSFYRRLPSFLCICYCVRVFAFCHFDCVQVHFADDASFFLLLLRFALFVHRFSVAAVRSQRVPRIRECDVVYSSIADTLFMKCIQI